jgi:hypothetical protein
MITWMLKSPNCFKQCIHDYQVDYLYAVQSLQFALESRLYMYAGCGTTHAPEETDLCRQQ